MADQTDLTRFIELLRQHGPVLGTQYHVRALSVFGSYVRQEQHVGSDLDVLVTFDEPPSLLKFIELENYLTDLLGVKVDLVMPEALKPRIAQRVLREAVDYTLWQQSLWNDKNITDISQAAMALRRNETS